MARVQPYQVAALMPDVCVTGEVLQAQIDLAHILTNRVETCDLANGSVLSEEELTVIEMNLAAHFYSFVDQQYLSKQTADASASFQGKTDLILDYSPWGQAAKLLDASGCLAKLEQQAETGRKRVKVLWLGTTGRNDRSSRPGE